MEQNIQRRAAFGYWVTGLVMEFACVLKAESISREVGVRGGWEFSANGDGDDGQRTPGLVYGDADLLFCVDAVRLDRTLDCRFAILSFPWPGSEYQSCPIVM